MGKKVKLDRNGKGSREEAFQITRKNTQEKDFLDGKAV